MVLITYAGICISLFEIPVNSGKSLTSMIRYQIDITAWQ